MRIIITSLFCAVSIIVTAQTNETNKANEFKERPFQLSFITPLGTNGIDSHLIANKVSLNILGGYSYGNSYFELAWLYNVNLHFTRGLVIAGLFNYSGNTENAVQLAGLFNSSMDGNANLQIGGILNLAKESTFQLSGISNISTGSTGAQLSGIVNIAEKSTFQLAVITNISLDAVGTQIGVINIAKEVNGLQFGLINIAEDMNGTPIGFFTFVKNGGKREFEIGFSESLNTFASFKSGVNRFYNISSIGVNYIDKPVLSGMGFGVGTQIDWKEGWGNQIEMLFYDIFDDKWPSLINLLLRQYEANFLYQLKIKTSKQFNDYFKVFAGPVFNLTASRRMDSDTERTGTALSPWSIWKTESKKTNINSWIGIEAGVSVSLK